MRTFISILSLLFICAIGVTIRESLMDDQKRSATVSAPAPSAKQGIYYMKISTPCAVDRTAAANMERAFQQVKGVVATISDMVDNNQAVLLKPLELALK